MAPEYVDYKDCERSKKGGACGCQGLPVPTATRWGISAGCAQAAHRSTGRSPRNPQAVGTTDPQGIRETVNDAGVIPGGWHPRESSDRLPRHANDKEFGMPDLTTSGAR